MKRLIALLLSLALTAAFVGCNSDESAQAEETTNTTTESTAAPFDLDAYKTFISDSVADIYDSAILLSNAGKYENNYWESMENFGSTPDAEKMLSSAMEWLESETGDDLDSIREQYDDNVASYKDIVSTDIDGSEAEEIKEVYEEYFDAYIGLYNLVTDPSGGRSSFIEKYNSYTNTITDCDSKLEILLS